MIWRVRAWKAGCRGGRRKGCCGDGTGLMRTHETTQVVRTPPPQLADGWQWATAQIVFYVLFVVCACSVSEFFCRLLLRVACTSRWAALKYRQPSRGSVADSFQDTRQHALCRFWDFKWLEQCDNVL